MTRHDSHQGSGKERIIYGENFISLVENANDSIVVVLGNGVISYANSFAVKMFGYNKTEVIGKSIKKFIASRELARVQLILIARLQGKAAPDRYHTILISKNQSEVPVEFSVSKTTWSSAPASLVIIRTMVLPDEKGE